MTGAAIGVHATRRFRVHEMFWDIVSIRSCVDRVAFTPFA